MINVTINQGTIIETRKKKGTNKEFFNRKGQTIVRSLKLIEALKDPARMDKKKLLKLESIIIALVKNNSNYLN